MPFLNLYMVNLVVLKKYHRFFKNYSQKIHPNIPLIECDIIKVFLCYKNKIGDIEVKFFDFL